MKKNQKIILVSAAALLVGGVAVYYFVNVLSKEPEISISNIDSNNGTATIKVGKKIFPYTYQKGVQMLGKVQMFYTAQVVAPDTSPGEADYIDVKVMKSGRLANTKRAYIG